MRERMHHFLRKNGIFLACGLLAWLAVSLGAYGLALKNYSADQHDEAVLLAAQAGRRPPEAELESRQGRVSGVQGGGGGRNLIFRLEGSEEAWTISPDLTISEAQRQVILTYIKPGIKIRALAIKKSGQIIELFANPDTPFQKRLMGTGESLVQLAKIPAAAKARAKIFLGLALVVFGLIPLLLAGHRFFGVFMKASPAELKSR